MKITNTAASSLTWTKSSYSGATNNCVEVAAGQLTGSLPIRDSKNPTGPAIVLDANAWTAFITSVKRSHLA